MTAPDETSLARIAAALERLSPPAPQAADLSGADVFQWRASDDALTPVAAPRRLPLDLLLGVDQAKAALLANTQRFAAGLPANHALLWGARGAGKSALVKAVHGAVAAAHPALKLIEVARAEAGAAARLARRLIGAEARAILFIDDLSFDAGDDAYKALKTMLDGGVGGEFDHVLVYVTSNRRHLIQRGPGDAARDFRPEETAEEQLSLSDRFGLWLGFHPMDQETYLAIVRTYCGRFGLAAEDAGLERAALQWAALRGARSGRTAWQFVCDRAGAMGKSLTAP
jgi:predicted AAA+ superfamily ATPase